MDPFHVSLIRAVTLTVPSLFPRNRKTVMEHLQGQRNTNMTQRCVTVSCQRLLTLYTAHYMHWSLSPPVSSRQARTRCPVNRDDAVGVHSPLCLRLCTTADILIPASLLHSTTSEDVGVTVRQLWLLEAQLNPPVGNCDRVPAGNGLCVQERLVVLLQVRAVTRSYSGSNAIRLTSTREASWSRMANISGSSARP